MIGAGMTHVQAGVIVVELGVIALVHLIGGLSPYFGRRRPPT